MNNTSTSALDTALWNLEASPRLMATAESLTRAVLPDELEGWGLDIKGWHEARGKLRVSLKEHLADHLRTLPDEPLTYIWGEHLTKDMERNTWKGLSSGEQEEVWTELADWMLIEVIH